MPKKIKTKENWEEEFDILLHLFALSWSLGFKKEKGIRLIKKEDLLSFIHQLLQRERQKIKEEILKRLEKWAYHNGIKISKEYYQEIKEIIESS